MAFITIPVLIYCMDRVLQRYSYIYTEAEMYIHQLSTFGIMFVGSPMKNTILMECFVSQTSSFVCIPMAMVLLDILSLHKLSRMICLPYFS